MKNIISELQNLVKDAWNFYMPPLYKLLIISIITFYISSSVLPIKFSLPAIDLKILDDLGLKPILPILALFLFSIILYTIEKATNSIGNLLPLKITYLTSRIIAQSTHFKMVVKKLPKVKHPDGTNTALDFYNQKIKAEQKEDILKSFDYWNRKDACYDQWFIFLKFIIIYLVIFLLLAFSFDIQINCGRWFLVLAITLTLIVIVIMRLAKIYEQIIYNKVKSVNIYLSLEKGIDEFSNELGSDNQEVTNVQIEHLNQPWWRIQFGFENWWVVYKSYHQKKWSEELNK